MKVKGRIEPEVRTVRIGELARRTGVPPRLLRYYEEQGLLAPRRQENAYRSYDESDVEQVVRVAGLVRSGVPTRLAKLLLDLEDLPPDAVPPPCPREDAEELVAHLADLDARIACLSRSRRTLHDHLVRTEHAALVLDRARTTPA